tara:strand:+ start:461 stop:1291 length:831 start_codon:yes stop_codon:yes gene_type:complete
MGRLAIIAAKGSQPLRLAHAVVTAGDTPIIIGLKGQTDADFGAFDYREIPVGQINMLLEHLQNKGITQLSLSGKFVRPSLHTIQPDSQALKLVSKALFSGDDKALKIVRDFFEKNGFEMVPEGRFLILDSLKAGEKFGPPPTKGQRRAIDIGVHALYQLGALDVGQCVITQGTRIIAIEGAEGTNEMIERASRHLLVSPYFPESRNIAFVKMAKTNQDLSLDPPVFGLETITCLKQAGISVVALHAEHCLFSSAREDIIASIAAAGMTMLAVEALH